MGLKTPEQYKSSLRDGRGCSIWGERVEDVTAHPESDWRASMRRSTMKWPRTPSTGSWRS